MNLATLLKSLSSKIANKGKCLLAKCHRRRHRKPSLLLSDSYGNVLSARLHLHDFVIVDAEMVLWEVVVEDVRGLFKESLVADAWKMHLEELFVNGAQFSAVWDKYQLEGLFVEPEEPLYLNQFFELFDRVNTMILEPSTNQVNAMIFEPSTNQVNNTIIEPSTQDSTITTSTSIEPYNQANTKTLESSNQASANTTITSITTLQQAQEATTPQPPKINKPQTAWYEVSMKPMAEIDSKPTTTTANQKTLPQRPRQKCMLVSIHDFDEEKVNTFFGLK